MPKLDQERQRKANSILSDAKELLEYSKDDEANATQSLSAIICQLDTDIAINVMEGLRTSHGDNEAMAIKVNYGY